MPHPAAATRSTVVVTEVAQCFSRGTYSLLTERRLGPGAGEHGGKVVFFVRFVSILRTYAAFLAGTSRMRWRWFVVANASGALTPRGPGAHHSSTTGWRVGR